MRADGKMLYTSSIVSIISSMWPVRYDDKLFTHLHCQHTNTIFMSAPFLILPKKSENQSIFLLKQTLRPKFLMSGET